MFDFGKSLINMDPDEQKKMLGDATPCQRRSALEMGVGFNNQNRQQQQRQQKRDACHDLDRLNFTVEKENEAHDFFGTGLADWQKNVTGKEPSRDANDLRKRFDDYEHSVLSTVPKGGKRHTALSESLPKIKDGFLKQGHRFVLDKLNERSRTVLDKGLQRIAQGAMGAKDEKGAQVHDDAAFDLINKYVLSEAKFDEKDADAMYGKYLDYAGAGGSKPAEYSLEGSDGEDEGRPKQDLKSNTQLTTVAKEKKESRERVSFKSSGLDAQEMEAKAQKGNESGKLAGSDNDMHYDKKGGADRKKEWTPTQTVAEAKRHVGSEAWRQDRKRGEFDDDDYKCNLFVSEMLQFSGAKVPMIGGRFGGNPPSAGQWADKKQDIDGYVVVEKPKPGDIASDGGHVGIVSSSGKTVSASSNAHKVVENDWGFRPNQKGLITFRRYVEAPTKP